MKKVLTGITLVLLFVIQTAAGKYIRIWNILPNLALVFAACYALTNSYVRAAVMGCACGLLLDRAGSGATGLNMLLCLYVCLGASYFSNRFYYENKLVIILGVLFVTVCYESIYILLTGVIFGRIPFFYTFVRYILPEAVINCLLGIPVGMWTKWLNNEYIRGI